MFLWLRLFKELPLVVVWVALAPLACGLARGGMGPSAKTQDAPMQNAGGNQANAQVGSAEQSAGNDSEGPRPARKGQDRLAIPTFARGMGKGKEKLDDVLNDVQLRDDAARVIEPDR